MFSIAKIYVWKGVSKTGKFCRGKTLERNILKIRKDLNKQGIIIRNIHLKRSLVVIKNIKPQDLFLFTRQLARLLQAGLPFTHVLSLLESNTNRVVLKEFIKQLQFQIQEGYSLTEALQKNRPYFNNFYCHLIALGEKTATLNQMLILIAAHMEKNLKIKSKLLSALLYPSIVIGVTSLTFLILMLAIIPQFEQLFGEIGAELPCLTRIVIHLSHSLKPICLFIGPIFILFISIFMLLKKNYPVIAMRQDRFLVKLPFLKKILGNIITARLSRALAIALTAGLPILDTLHSIAGLTKNRVYKHAILMSGELLRNGESFYKALLLQKVFPDEFLRFVLFGEVSASLSEMLNNAADFYEEKIDFFVGNLIKMLEPLLIILLSLIIGTLIIAMYLPIFNLGSVI